MKNEPIIRVKDVVRKFDAGDQSIYAVNGVSLDIYPSRVTVVAGRSGAGKTTLLNLIAGLDSPSGGTITIDGVNLQQIDENARLEIRRRKVGFVFQNFGLLPLLSAAENVSIPLRMRNLAYRQRQDHIERALDAVGLSSRSRHRPHELSGGEQQRVAIARAIATEPEILIADEPTGQLDSQTGKRIVDLIVDLAVSRDITVIIATHDQQIMDVADAKHVLRDGQIIQSAYST